MSIAILLARQFPKNKTKLNYNKLAIKIRNYIIKNVDYCKTKKQKLIIRIINCQLEGIERI